MRRGYPICAGLVAIAALAAVVMPTVAHDASMHVNPVGSVMTFPDESPFLAENSAAMDKMMVGMQVKPSGDIDADFSAMMLPHHQGAIDMAVAYLRYGKNEKLRRIAQEIIVDQQQEIAALRVALGQPLPPSMAAPTQPEIPSNTMLAYDHPASYEMQRPPGMQMQIK